MKIRSLAIAFLLSLVAGCQADATDAGDAAPPPQESGEDNFSSDVATLLDFEFSGELLTTNATNTKAQIKAQLFYTVGTFNHHSGVARLNKVTLTNITTAAAGGGLTKISYKAKLPVAWGSKSNLPTTYTLSLPRRVDQTGQDAFVSRYGQSCSDEPGSVSVSNFWYHYRPLASSCALADADVLTTNAKVTVSAANTTGKYPEYHRVWEDGVLQVLAVFGKYEEGATSDYDAGIEAYNEFIRAVRSSLPNLATTPASLPELPGVANPDVTLEGVLADGRAVTVTAILVDKVATAPASFDARYSELSPGADLIFYGGHAGLGANVAALSKKGKFFPGKYQLLFLNGCDTFAYQDDTLATTRAALNADDKSGTRYMDIIANAMPAYFSSMPQAGMALIDGLISLDAPRTYEQIFKDIDKAQSVVVTGEEDNVFVPGPAQSLRLVQDEAGTVGYKETVSFETAELPAGKYVFEMTPEPGAPGGDADLRVRAGAKPTTDKTYKCPSYLYNSNERCTLSLTKAQKVYFTVTGDKSVPSSFVVRAFKQ